MAQLRGLNKLVSQLRGRAARARKDWDVAAAVGYTAAYAVRVHEDLEASHKTGQAKFLEQPFRELQDVLWRTVAVAVKAGKTPAQAFLLAGLRLLRDSQKLVPVLTGNLRASGFVRLENK